MTQGIGQDHESIHFIIAKQLIDENKKRLITLRKGWQISTTFPQHHLLLLFALLFLLLLLLFSLRGLSEENVRVSEGGFVLDGVPMAFIFHDGVARQIQNPRQRVANTLTRLSVRRVLVPNGHDILLAK